MFLNFAAPKNLLKTELVNVDAPNWIKIHEIVQSDESLMKWVIMNNKYLVHFACWKSAPTDFITELLNACPGACQEKDDDRWLPLHYAFRYKQSESAIQALITTCPKACQERIDDGQFPLHYACRYIQSELVIRTLIIILPQACQEKDKLGCLPLHYACRSNQSESVI